MKLAEALILRADYQKRAEQLKHRLLRNAQVQEGDEPSENPQKLLEELEQLAGELTRLIQQINRTNLSATIDQGTSLTDALAVRDVLKLRVDAYRELAHAASVTQGRYSKSEVKFKSTVNVERIQRQADDLAKQYRELDARIQEANWRTDLME